jgi:hypothetical protein
MTNLEGEKTKSTSEFAYDDKILVHENKSQLCLTVFTDILFSYILQEKIPRLAYTSVMWTSNTWK